MIKISKKVEYSLMILKHFEEAQGTDLITARQICDAYHTPFDTTAKVMQVMNNAKILGSIKGANGGYSLTKNLSEINYLELTELIEGKKLAPTCSDMNCSLLSSCNISSPVQKLNSKLTDFFQELSIKDLLAENLTSINQRAL